MIWPSLHLYEDSFHTTQPQRTSLRLTVGQAETGRHQGNLDMAWPKVCDIYDPLTPVCEVGSPINSLTGARNAPQPVHRSGPCSALGMSEMAILQELASLDPQSHVDKPDGGLLEAGKLLGVFIGQCPSVRQILT